MNVAESFANYRRHYWEPPGLTGRNQKKVISVAILEKKACFLRVYHTVLHKYLRHNFFQQETVLKSTASWSWNSEVE